MTLNTRLAKLGEKHARELDDVIEHYDAEITKAYERAASHSGEARFTHLRDSLTATVQAARTVANELGSQHLMAEIREVLGTHTHLLAIDLGAHPRKSDITQYVTDAVELAKSKADSEGIESTAYRGQTIVESEAVLSYDSARKDGERTLSKMSDERARRLGFQAARSVPRGVKRDAVGLSTRDDGGFIPVLGKVWSAINDRRTCQICADKDGELGLLALDFGGDSPPVHARCRCVTHLWAVAWVKGERDMPIPTRDKPYSYDVSLDVREAEVDSYQRCIRGCVASDESLDSHGTVLLASGWDLSRYAKNPVLKWGHHCFGNPAQPEDIMGTAPSRVDGSRLVTDLQFSPKGLNPKADMVFDQVSSGIVKGLSVEFKPLEYHIEKDEKGDETVIVDRAMLAAISIVPVPSNPNALTRAMLEGEGEQDDVRKTPSKALVVEPENTRATHDAGANEGAARPAKEKTMSDQDTTVGLPASIAALLGVDNEEAARGAISTLMLKIDNAEKRAIESETRAVKAESDLKARVDAEVTAEVDGLIKSKRIDESKREAALTLARVNIGAFREMYPAQAPAAAEGPKTEVLERHISKSPNPRVTEKPSRPIAEMQREMQDKIAELKKAGLNHEEAHIRALEYFMTRPEAK